MADNKTKIDRLHDLLPSYLNSKTNTNWAALIDAIGASDELTAQLISQVKQQFFVQTASRPYIDTLAANVSVSRPKFIGMDDQSFRQYIPVLSYKPKQVKLIIDQLLDIFFFKQSTTAYVTSGQAQPFALQDGWELQYLVDEINAEFIKFNASDFTDITNALASEVAAAINRQSQFSYATAEFDSISKNYYIQLFTTTVGSKGSIRITGGRANVPLQFNGFITTAGNGPNTEWTVTKVGDIVTFQYMAGANPGLDQLQIGDIAIINLAGNVGSFPITNVDLNDNLIQFVNLFGTPETITQTDDTQMKFLRPNKYVAYTNPNRAMTWETSPGEIVVEMPTSPPVVKRSLMGSFHMNGTLSQVSSIDSDTQITLQDASEFPESGTFWLQPACAIESRYLTPSEDTTVTSLSTGRLEGQLQKYQYTSRTASTTTGDLTVGSKQILNVANVSGLSNGMSVFVPGLPPYTLIASILGNTVTVSQPATITALGSSINFAGNTLTGITPDLPEAVSLNQFALSSLTRTSNSLVTATTTASHDFLVGDVVIINQSSGVVDRITTGDTTSGSNVVLNIANMTGIGPGMVVSASGIPAGTTVVSVSANTATLSAQATITSVGVVLSFNENLNGAFPITSITSNTFTYLFLGNNGTAITPGIARVERIGLAQTGSQVILTNSQSNSATRITGCYVWDLKAPFVLSSNTATTVDAIQAGKIVKLLNVSPNTIPTATGYVVFDYGTNVQEGPVRYLYTPSSTTIALDPSYTFQFDHQVGSAVVSIDQKGPHVMSGLGTEYGPYVTNPSDARTILENLILSVKSSGIFIDFLIRYPEQFYGLLDVYDSTSSSS